MPIHAENTTFQADPGAYILTHACTFLGFSKSEDGPKQFTEWSRQGCGTIGYRYLNRNRMTLKPELHTPSICPTVPTIRLTSDAIAGQKVCFLPWEASRATLTHMDASADLFFTGPLSGCQIYYADKPGYPPLMFHINANDDDKSPEQRFDMFRSKKSIKKRDFKHNVAVKDAEAQRIAQYFGYTIRGRKARGEYETPAFAWGRKIGTTWEMYLHDVDPVANFAFRNERIF